MKTINDYKLLAIILQDRAQIQFTDNDLLIRVFEAEGTDGYMVDVWTMDTFDFDDINDPVDGGICTGDEYNAVTFYLNEAPKG